MPLNPPSGNMYPWAYTWNPIGGRCHHNCDYCYVSDFKIPVLMRKYSREPYLVEKELKTKLIIPKGYVLFVCSCYDIVGEWVPKEWIRRILAHCREYEDETTFLFQSKNPKRFCDFVEAFPVNTILGTTIETNRDYGVTKAPSPIRRYAAIINIEDIVHFRWMVSIEPVMDFDLDIMLRWMERIPPVFVSIGADSGKNDLPEPSPKKLQSLISGLRKVTEVRLKKNLGRLLK